MAGNRFQLPVAAVYDENGAPLAGAKLYFYENNTTTPKDTYSDIDLTTANQWPVVADSSGRFTDDIFMDTDAYRIKLTDSAGVTIWSKDDCNTFNGAPTDAVFPFPGAVVEFYGTQGQLDVATAAFWYVMDGNNGLPNLDDTYIKACIDVASIGTTGGATTPTGAADSHVLTIAEMPAHKFLNGVGSDEVTPFVYGGSSSGVPGSSTKRLNVTGAAAVQQGYTETLGSGSGHTHTLTMNAFEPPYYQLIKLVYLGY
jgi:hypothetical protein